MVLPISCRYVTHRDGQTKLMVGDTEDRLVRRQVSVFGVTTFGGMFLYAIHKGMYIQFLCFMISLSILLVCVSNSWRIDALTTLETGLVYCQNLSLKIKLFHLYSSQSDAKQEVSLYVAFVRMLCGWCHTDDLSIFITGFKTRLSCCHRSERSSASNAVSRYNITSLA